LGELNVPGPQVQGLILERRVAGGQEQGQAGLGGEDGGERAGDATAGTAVILAGYGSVEERRGVGHGVALSLQRNQMTA
jgi:hypothetical protein